MTSIHTIPVISGRKNPLEATPEDQDKLKGPRKIENFFALLKESRRLTLGLKKSDLAFLAFIASATISITFVNSAYTAS